jgi:hypothetical protein
MDTVVCQGGGSLPGGHHRQMFLRGDEYGTSLGGETAQCSSFRAQILGCPAPLVVADREHEGLHENNAYLVVQAVECVAQGSGILLGGRHEAGAVIVSPDVVDADQDRYDVGAVGQNIAVPAPGEVRSEISADSGIGHAGTVQGR